MYRLTTVKGSWNIRLLINRKKYVENRAQNFHTLLNRSTYFSLLSEQVRKTTAPLIQQQQITASNGSINAELLQKMIQKKKKKGKKYAELLQITTDSMKQTTTPIKKLKAKKLSNFIDKAHEEIKRKGINDNHNSPVVFVNNNIDELKLSSDKLHDIMDSYNAFKETTEGVTEAFEEETAVVEESETVTEEQHLFEEEDGNEIIPEVVLKKTPKLKKKFQSSTANSITEAEHKLKQKSLAISLCSYIDCCVQNGMVNRGYLTIIRYRWKSKNAGAYGLKIQDINIYNILMKGYSQEENYLKLREIMAILEEDRIKPNEQTFALLLDCLGRLSYSSTSLSKNKIKNYQELKDTINKVIKEASKFHISLNDIFQKTIFIKDQREMVLHAVKLVHPLFIPSYEAPNILYNNRLVNKLNANVQDISYDPIVNIHRKLEGSEIMEGIKGFNRSDLETWSREQLLNELNGEVTIKSVFKYPEPTPKVINYRNKLEELQKKWRECIISSFNRDFNVLRAEMKTRGGQNLMPYLRTLEVEQYADILLNEIRQLTEGSETYSPYISQLYGMLGSKVEMRYQVEQKMKLGVLQKTGDIYGKYCDIITAGNSSDNSRQCFQRLIYQSQNEGPSMNFHHQPWPMGARIGVGKFLYNILIRDVKLDPNFIRTGKHQNENLTSAFFTLFRYQGRSVKEEVKPHPILMKLYRGSQLETLTFDVNLVPMVCPPQPYWSIKNGGYLVAETDFLRLPSNCRQQNDMLEDMPVQDLYPVLDALNQQQSVAWQINTDILDVVIKVFNEGGNLKLDIPQLPETLPPLEMPENESSLSNSEKFKLFREKLTHRKKQAEMYSLWCDAHYRLSLANHFRNRVFWLPHNLDFRGRFYSIPPHLSHLSADLGRSLLKFHKKKKLGIDGLSWLKLHCINLTGLKKRNSIRERLLFAEEILDEILDSADNPLNGRRWWLKSDEPWQTLACCMEIANAIRSGDPENFESNIPIHQDGSCNGLQHYAALGRDTLGANSVNLSPNETPRDVYSDVVALVEKARQKDEENNVPVAKILRNFVLRKVIKQTVMTTVYGVTRYGARLQIAKQLKDIDDFPKEWVWPASSYLASKTFDSIREMFTSAREIQDWFVDCARLISTVCCDNVEWVTPLGLPVVQPYSRIKIKYSQTNMEKNNVTDMSKTPNGLKQRNAFPPNFIHSLDSSHMMLTSVHCEKIGLTFASVHDCYWTHASTVPEMSRICREQFVALHSEPILEDLSKFLFKKYSFDFKQMDFDGSTKDLSKRKLNRILTQVPKKGDFDLKTVLDSVYFFS
ncbi:hypothetical protein PVAND_004858 [Polypedilum vanderplanki]|uniref:DNA-directed RNA polymerase n=1 Tax=Polypedilum vanderplanki TaxID=319348 RepID=A0A9J6BY66_POLVA|nr:hypothetical protein PVAND_004858 [Polypedilum vanderplanki]